jgi:RNA polymerase sigma-70 factor (ECF subfamily)
MSPPTVSTSTDHELVGRVLRGDTAAFEHIVRCTEGLVARLVFKMIRHPVDRPNLAQEVYLKAFKNLAGFKFQAKLSTWVGQIAYNTCLHYLEKKQLVLLDDFHPDADEPFDHHWPHAAAPVAWFWASFAELFQDVAPILLLLGLPAAAALLLLAGEALLAHRRQLAVLRSV